MFAYWLTYVYFNVFTNNVNKKMNKKALFLATPDRKSSELTSRVNSGHRGINTYYLRHRGTSLHGFLSGLEIRVSEYQEIKV